MKLGYLVGKYYCQQILKLAAVACLSIFIAKTSWAVDCDVVFTDGVQSNNSGGKVDINSNVSITGTDGVFDSAEVSGGGSGSACGGSSCSASGSTSATSSPSFQTGSGSDGDLDVSGTTTVGNSGDNDFKKITVNDNNTLTFSDSSSVYYIEEMDIKKTTTINVSAVDYWIDGNVIIDEDSDLIVTGTPTARIFINGSITINKNVDVNKTGSASQLLIYATGDIILEENVELTGYLYAGLKVDIKNGASIIGAVSGKDVVFADNSSLVADTSGLTSGSFGGFCEAAAPPITIDHFEIVHDAAGSTCANETVTVNACVNTSCTILSADSISLDFQLDGVTETSPSFTGSVSLSITHSVSEIVTFSVANSSATETNSPICDDGSGTSCDMAFDSVSCTVAHYTMDEASWGVVIDSAGGFNGTAFNGANTTGGACRYGEFDGTDDYVQIPHNAVLNGSSDLTYAALVRADTWSGTTQIMAKSVHGGGSGRAQMGIFSESGVFKGRAETADGREEIQTTLPVVAGDWVHVALVFNSTSLTLYLDGVSVATTSFSSTTLVQTTDPLNISKRVGTDEYYFDGLIDDVRVYTNALSAQEILALFNQSSHCPLLDPDHYAISHSSPGLTCEATLVTVTAHDSSHNLVNVAVDTDLTVTTNPVVSSIISSPATILDGNSSTTFYLNQTSALASIDIDVTDGSATDPDDAGAEDPTIDFLDTGFRFYVGGVHTGTTPIGTQIAGKSSATVPGNQTLTLRAIRTSTDTGACEAALVGTQAVDVAYECNNPTTCSSSPLLSFVADNTVNAGKNDNGSVSNYTSVNMLFDASGIAPFSFNFSDIGLITLHAQKSVAASSPEPAFTLVGNSNAFVSRPFGLSVVVTGNAAAVDDTGGKFVAAGVGFNVVVNGVLYDGAEDSNNDGHPDGHNDSNQANNVDLSDNIVAPNFGAESETVTLSRELIHPTSGGANQGALGGTEVINSFVDGSGNTGSATTFSEVGVIDIIASITDADYLGVGVLYGRSSYVGRFYPDHFDVVVTDDGDFSGVCGNFIYIGQPFSYSTQPALTITAKNFAGTITENYSEVNYKKLLTSDINRTFPSADNSTNGSDGLTKMVATTNVSNGTLSAGSAGVMTYTFDAGDEFTYTKEANSMIDLFNPDLIIAITAVIDVDGVAASSLPSVTPTAAGIDLRFGRLRLENAFGPETASLSVPINTEYYDGTNFVTNTDDNCMSLVEVDFDLNVIDDDAVDNSNDPSAGDFTAIPIDASFTTSGSIGNDPFVSGFADFSFTAPGAGATSAIEIQMDINANFSWLLYDWDGMGVFDDSPSSTATFGRYRGHDRIIYWREVTN